MQLTSSRRSSRRRPPSRRRSSPSRPGARGGGGACPGESTERALAVGERDAGLLMDQRASARSLGSLISSSEAAAKARREVGHGGAAFARLRARLSVAIPARATSCSMSSTTMSFRPTLPIPATNEVSTRTPSSEGRSTAATASSTTSETASTSMPYYLRADVDDDDHAEFFSSPA